MAVPLDIERARHQPIEPPERLNWQVRVCDEVRQPLLDFVELDRRELVVSLMCDGAALASADIGQNGRRRVERRHGCLTVMRVNGWTKGGVGGLGGFPPPLLERLRY